MDASEFFKAMEQVNACDPGKTWGTNKSLQEAWESCPDGKWMFWFARTIKVDPIVLAIAAHNMTKMAIPYISVGQARYQDIVDKTDERLQQETPNLTPVSAAIIDTAVAALENMSDQEFGKSESAKIMRQYVPVSKFQEALSATN